MQTLFVPSLGLDVSLIERLANSIDFPIRFKCVLNNGNPGALDEFHARHPDWILKEADFGNMGVAGSWNHCAKMFPDEKSWLIMNEDAWFLPGYLEKICACADKHPNAPMIFLNDSQSYYCFVWTAKGRQDFGEFDENFWPAYSEDVDMRVRHKHRGVEIFPYALQGYEPLPHSKPMVGGTNYNALIQGTGLLNRAYWLKKWGGMNHEVVYNTPYRDPRLSISEWVWSHEHRANLKPLFETFMALPNPSIYS